MSAKEEKISVDAGKYTLVWSIEPGKAKFECLRYGEPWRDMVGDNMILSLFQEIQASKESITAIYKLAAAAIEDPTNAARFLDMISKITQDGATAEQAVKNAEVLRKVVETLNSVKTEEPKKNVIYQIRLVNSDTGSEIIHNYRSADFSQAEVLNLFKNMFLKEVIGSDKVPTSIYFGAEGSSYYNRNAKYCGLIQYYDYRVNCFLLEFKEEEFFEEKTDIPEPKLEDVFEWENDGSDYDDLKTDIEERLRG